MLCELSKTIQQGWPESKSDITEALHAYSDFRDDQDQMVFKGPVVVVPAALRCVFVGPGSVYFGLGWLLT